MARTIVALTSVVALTLAACTTEDTRGWSDEAFRDVMTYCQAVTTSGCANLIINIRDGGECSVDAAYRIIDVIQANDEPVEAVSDLVDNVLIPAGDCLGYDSQDE